MEELFEPGSYMVPSYNAHGKPMSTGRVLGTEQEVRGALTAVYGHASKVGKLKTNHPDTNKVINKKLGKKDKKQKKIEDNAVSNFIDPLLSSKEFPLSPATTAPPEWMLSAVKTARGITTDQKDINLIGVDFKNKFGKIKLYAEAVIEEDTSLCIIFSEEKELRFIPEQGEELSMIYEGVEHKVMYPGFLYTWLDGRKKLLILVKNV